MHSVLWDLNIPLEVATITYEGNDTCTAMANAQTPTPCTQHMDIKYIALCDWVEQYLLILDWIDTKIKLEIPSLRHYNTPLKTNKKFYIQFFVLINVYCF